MPAGFYDFCGSVRGKALQDLRGLLAVSIGNIYLTGLKEARWF